MLRLGAFVAGLWAGALMCIGFIAAPSAFAVLASADAGRVVGRMLALEAYLGLALAALLYIVVRRQARRAAEEGKGSVVSVNVLLVLGTLFCTVAGHFAILPMLEAARAGQGAYSFAALHGVSVAFFALKAALVLALAWRLG